MADVEAQPEPQATEDERPTALIGRGESVLVKEVPKADGEETDFESEIALIKESEVSQHSTCIPTNSHHLQLSFTCTN